MSPLPVVAAGAVKATSAKSMAKAFSMMNKIDWEGVNNAMTSMKDFGASASLVQETLGDINDQALALVDIGLGPYLTKLAEDFNLLFEKLQPLAEGFANWTSTIEADLKKWQEEVSTSIGTLLGNVLKQIRDAWETFWEDLFTPGAIALPGSSSIPIGSGFPSKKIKDIEGAF